MNHIKPAPYWAVVVGSWVFGGLEMGCNGLISRRRTYQTIFELDSAESARPEKIYIYTFFSVKYEVSDNYAV